MDEEEHTTPLTTTTRHYCNIPTTLVLVTNRNACDDPTTTALIKDWRAFTFTNTPFLRLPISRSCFLSLHWLLGNHHGWPGSLFLSTLDYRTITTTINNQHSSLSDSDLSHRNEWGKWRTGILFAGCGRKGGWTWLVGTRLFYSSSWGCGKDMLRTGFYSSRVLLDGGRRSLSCLLAVTFPLLLVYY